MSWQQCLMESLEEAEQKGYDAFQRGEVIKPEPKPENYYAKADYSQDKRDGSIKYLQANTVGKVKRIYDYGSHCKHHRFLIYLRIPGHPETNFWSEELTKVRV